MTIKPREQMHSQISPCYLRDEIRRKSSGSGGGDSAVADVFAIICCSRSVLSLDAGFSATEAYYIKWLSDRLL